jgi:hypothetical protein
VPRLGIKPEAGARGRSQRAGAKGQEPEAEPEGRSQRAGARKQKLFMMVELLCWSQRGQEISRADGCPGRGRGQ